MLQIACPWCGPRDEIEFSYGGQAHLACPPDAQAVTDAVWADYLYMRTNPKGRHLERWVHAHGCGRWFNVARDTSTERVLAVYEVGAAAPTKPDDPT